MKQKNKILAAILALFLGTLGVHRFYVGKIGSGAVMLLVSITFFGLIVTVVWALVDFVMILLGKFHDKQGNALV